MRCFQANSGAEKIIVWTISQHLLELVMSEQKCVGELSNETILFQAKHRKSI